MQVKFSINKEKLEDLKDYLRDVTYGAKKIGFKAFVEYIIGDSRHGLKHPPPYKYVSRADAYGSTGATFPNGAPVPDGYFSAEQFGYVMAMISKGEMNPGTNNRTGAVEDGWYSVETQHGYAASIRNDEPGAYYTMDDTGQARQPALVGWRKITRVIADNFDGAIRYANSKVGEFLKSKK